MKKELDIYNYGRILVSCVRSVEQSKMSVKNKRFILDFKDSLVRENLSLPRVIKYLNTMKVVALWFKKDFDRVTKKDVEGFVSYLHTKQDYSPWTKNGYKVMLKRFFRWLKNSGKDYPEEVKWISLRISASEINLPGKGDLVSEDEVKRLIETASQPRDKALISVLYESGCRIGEIASMQIKNVEFDEMGLLFTVMGKTGSRKIRIIASTQYVMNWLSIHPLRDDRNAPLWVNIGNHQTEVYLRYPRIRILLNRLFVKAGIKKRGNPHSFRHARATFLAQHLTEFQMNQYFGWKQGSDMPSTYVHMCGRDLDDAIFRVNGVGNKKEAEKPKMQPAVCPRCQEINSFGSKYCNKCAAMLDVQTIIDYEHRKRNEGIQTEVSNLIAEIVMADSEMKAKVLPRLKSAGIVNGV